MFGDIKKELEETSVKHQNRCSSHLLAAYKNVHKHREDHFSCLIKQSVYDDSCQKDTDALRQKCGNESSVKSLKWAFWQQRSGRTDE